MNANPHTCPHLSLIYEKVAGGVPFIRCDDCNTTWDADEPISEHYDITAQDYPADWETFADLRDAIDKTTGSPDFNKPRLNPDNEPDSEHNKYKDNDK